MAAGVVHFEIQANDVERAKKFYEDLFAWEFERMGGPTEYWLIRTGRTQGRDGTQVGIDGGLLVKGGKDAGEGASPNAFVCTIQVEDLDSTLQQAAEAGAAVQMPKDQIPGVGWLSYLKDTEGNIFGVLQPER
jgi:predicted enzyme related to lactoylglutathione lyase